MTNSQGSPGKPGEPAQGNMGGKGGEGGRGGEGSLTGGAGGAGGPGGAINARDSLEDIRERLSTAAVQITQHVNNAQSELDKLRNIVDDLAQRVKVLEDIEEHRGEN